MILRAQPQGGEADGQTNVFGNQEIETAQGKGEGDQRGN